MQQKKELNLISIRDCLENFSNFDDISLLNGTSGYLLLLLNLYLIDMDSYYEDLALETVQKLDLNFVVNRENRGLWSGPVGFAFVLNLWNKYSNNPKFERYSKELHVVAEAIIRTFLEDEVECFQISENVDIIYGLAGGLIYFTSLKNYNKNEGLPNDVKDSIVEIFQKIKIYEMAAMAEEEKQRFFSSPGKEKLINFSMSHGIISLFNSLTFFDFTNSNFYNENLIFIENIYKRIRHAYFKTPEYIAIDESMNLSQTYFRNNINYSWCYGLYGHYIFLKNINYDFKEVLLGMLLDRVQEVVRYKKKTNNVCFCHGLSGLLYSCYEVTALEESEEFVRLLEKKSL